MNQDEQKLVDMLSTQIEKQGALLVWDKLENLLVNVRPAWETVEEPELQLQD